MRTPGRKTLHFFPIFVASLALATAIQLAAPAHAGPGPTSCTDTSIAGLAACQDDAEAEYQTGLGICENEALPADETACKAEAAIVRLDALELCDDQDGARAEVCAALGEAPYDPAINPVNFVDPARIGNAVAPNRFFPITRGLKWTYKGEDEVNVVNVTNRTKTILGVKCAVIHDVVKEDGALVEDTEDWYAQDVQGNVWYMGEISRQYEGGELVGIEGSWKAGRDGARPGVLMYATPPLGTTYRQEFLLGEAEDMGTVISLTGSASTPAGSCNGNCVVTNDFSALEPGVSEQKYFKRGVGLIQEVDPETGDPIVKLVAFQQP